MSFIYGYNRNRALDAYILNENITEFSLEDPEAKYKAINPAMFMIRIDAQDDQGNYKPLAAFSSFSVHATALSVPVEVYNSDLFAYAQKDLEWAISGISRGLENATICGRADSVLARSISLRAIRIGSPTLGIYSCAC